MRELPPRARRIQDKASQDDWRRGTTSACAENTFRYRHQHSQHGNYLRVRGEYRVNSKISEWVEELPPRARRIHTTIITTTATPWNYLRVRGEYIEEWFPIPEDWELPPRARRIPRDCHHFGGGYGTTSACAENTSSWTPQACNARNYLRVRGEYNCGSPAAWVVKELPPRARRIRPMDSVTSGAMGTTSACAENTRSSKGCF